MNRFLECSTRTALLLIIASLAGCSRQAVELSMDEGDTALPGPAPARDWPQSRGDPGLTGIAHGELPDSLTLLWTYHTAGSVKSSAVAAAGRVFVGSDDGKVHAFNLADGHSIWTFDTGETVEAPPLVLGERVFVGDTLGVVHALDAASGKSLWKFETGDKIIGAVIWFVHGGKTNLLVGSHDVFLHSLDAATGDSNAQ